MQGTNKGRYLRSHPTVGVIVLYAVVGFILYFQVISEAGFVFDDLEYIVDNPILFDLPSLLRNFSDPRQIGYLSFAINYLVGGTDPLGYHLVNVVIHIANAVLVFFLVSRLLALAGWSREQLGSRTLFTLPAAAGLLFLVHPLQTQAVSYVTQRFTSLAVLFYLLSVVLYLEARARMDGSGQRTRGMTLYWLAVLSALLAMKVKEISFTLPLVILAVEILLIGGYPVRAKSIYLVVPFLATMVIIPLSIIGPEWGLIERSVGVAESTRALKIIDLTTRSPLEYFATQMRVLVIYLRLLFLPYSQSVVYEITASRSLWEPKVLLSLFLHLSLCAGAVVLWFRSSREGISRAPLLRLAALGIGWFYVTASVESSVIPIKDLIFEHRAYLPGVGILMAVCSAALLLAGTGDERRLAARFPIAVLAVVVVFGGATIARNKVWLNELVLWDDVIVKAPNKAIGYNNRGNALKGLGRLEEAIQDINTTIRIVEKTIGRPLAWEEADYTQENLAKTYLGRAEIHRALGDYEQADADMRTAKFMMMSTTPIPLEQERARAASLFEQGAYAEAVQVYSTILAWFPDDLDAIIGRANAFAGRGTYDNALHDLDAAVRRHPGSPVPLYYRGITYLRMGKREAAAADLERSCTMGYPPACEGRATIRQGER
ncbi:MAG: hypothetical protein OEW15_01870 [Nitrospirota bacterium]|nr:hypothetical protein [Nitrospirota bacterium]